MQPHVCASCDGKSISSHVVSISWFAQKCFEQPEGKQSRLLLQFPVANIGVPSELVRISGSLGPLLFAERKLRRRKKININTKNTINLASLFTKNIITEVFVPRGRLELPRS